MKVRINVRIVNARQAFRASTYMALLEAEEDASWVKFGDNLGRTRQYDSWNEAANQAIKLAAKKRYEITNLGLVLAKMGGS